MNLRSKIIAGAAFTLCLTYIFWWVAIRPPNADEVARMTAHALETQNVDELLRLTAPTERQRLDLNRSNVSAFLKDTIFNDGPIGRMAVSQVGDYPVDEPSYELVPLDRHDLFRSLRIKVTQLPDGRWYLPLGYTLLLAYGASHPSEDARGRHYGFIREASKYGVR